MIDIYNMESPPLKSLLKNADYVSQSLATLKQNIQNSVKASQFHDPPSHYIQQAIELKQAFRSLADGIEAKRLLAQLQKEKLEKRKVFFQGLQYYKQTLKNKIKECSIPVISLHQYLQAPIEPSDWNEGFSQTQQRLKSQLAVKINKQVQYEQKLKEKQKIQQQKILNDEKYQQLMPQHGKKLYEQVMETSKQFNIGEPQKLEVIREKKLASIYDQIAPLRASNLLSIEYNNEPYEEIELVIHKSDHKLYQLAKANRLPIVEKDLKFTISCLQPHFSGLVIGVDRREDFTTEQVFQRLVNDQKIKEVFRQPQNELERNINNKYVYLEWINYELSNGIISPSIFLDLIKERLFSLETMAFLTANFKKLNYFFPLWAENETSININLKKVSFNAFDKLKFDQYLKLVHQPNWVNKYMTQYAILKQEHQRMTLEHQLLNPINRTSFNLILKQLKLQQLEQSLLNYYYRVSITIGSRTIVAIFIIPLAYPKKPSFVRIIDLSKRKDEEKRVYPSVPCKGKMVDDGHRFNEQMSFIENALNQDISYFLKTVDNGSFLLIIQINRLISLFYRMEEPFIK